MAVFLIAYGLSLYRSIAILSMSCLCLGNMMSQSVVSFIKQGTLQPHDVTHADSSDSLTWSVAAAFCFKFNTKLLKFYFYLVAYFQITSGLVPVINILLVLASGRVKFVEPNLSQFSADKNTIDLLTPLHLSNYHGGDEVVWLKSVATLGIIMTSLWMVPAMQRS